MEGEVEAVGGLEREGSPKEKGREQSTARLTGQAAGTAEGATHGLVCPASGHEATPTPPLNAAFAATVHTGAGGLPIPGRSRVLCPVGCAAP